MGSSRRALLWSPRIMGILVCLFIGMFALDAFSEGKGVLEALPDFVIHLIPALLLLVVVAVSWKWEWVGGLMFLGLAAAYAVMARRHPDWILVISGPLLIVGVLYLWGWRRHDELHASW